MDQGPTRRDVLTPALGRPGQGACFWCFRQWMAAISRSLGGHVPGTEHFLCKKAHQLSTFALLCLCGLRAWRGSLRSQPTRPGAAEHLYCTGPAQKRTRLPGKSWEASCSRRAPRFKPRESRRRTVCLVMGNDFEREGLSRLTMETAAARFRSAGHRSGFSLSPWSQAHACRAWPRMDRAARAVTQRFPDLPKMACQNKKMFVRLNFFHFVGFEAII